MQPSGNGRCNPFGIGGRRLELQDTVATCCVSCPSAGPPGPAMIRFATSLAGFSMSNRNLGRHGRAPNRDPQVMLQKAVREYQAGRLPQARKALMPLRKQPDREGFITLLAGLVEAGLGEWKQARELLSKAVSMLPRRAEGWMGLGNAERMLGNPREAIAAYEQALDLQPQLAGGWNNLGMAYADLKFERAAIRYYERAIQCAGKYKEAAQNRAEAFVRLASFEEARRAYQSLAQEYPGDLEIALAYAETLEKANQVDLAWESLTQLVNVDTPQLLARREVLRGRLLARQGELEQALEVVRSVRNQTGAEWVGYLEGDLLDRTGQAAPAMEAFLRANAARSRDWSFRRLRDQQTLEFLEHKISRGIDPPPAVTADEMEYRTPVFIVGLPRSGTTLLDRILGAHPDVQVLEEPASLHAVEHERDRGGTVPEMRAHYWDYLEKTVDIEPDRLVVDKNPLHTFCLDLLPIIFPNANVIYSLRHPYDSALSCFMQDFGPNPATLLFLDIESTATLCARSLQMMQLYEQACPDRVHRVHYESLVAGDLRAGIEPVLHSIGLEWHPDIERYADKAARSGLIKTASYEQVTRGIYSSAVGRWRRYEEWLGPFRETLGPMLEYWGYEE